MTNPRKRPRNAIVLRRYEDLDPYVKAFAAGKLNLLFLVGEAGLQKSRCVRRAVEAGGDKALHLEGHVTAFEMYRELHAHRDELVLLDDADGLAGSREGIRLLKCLCQTELRKTVSWHSASPKLEAEGIPTSFDTESRACIIANDWKTLNENVAALEDRGHLLFFEPTALEVHRRTAEWFDDQEVFDFIAEHLHLIAKPSMRHYVNARELKRTEDPAIDWREAMLNRWLPPRRQLVARLKADPSFASEEERVQAFVNQKGGSRATYFRYAKTLEPPAQPPRIALPFLAANPCCLPRLAN
jgi:hypothetical protein